MKRAGKVGFVVLALVVLIFLASSASADDPIIAKDNDVVRVEVYYPSTVVYGHRPFSVTVNVSNISTETVSIDGRMYIGGSAWGQENYPYHVTKGRIYDQKCNTPDTIGGCGYWWQAELQVGEVAQFVLPTFSGTQLGTYSFFMAGFDSSFGDSIVILPQPLTLVGGTEEPYGQFSIEPYFNSEEWRPGELKGLHLELWAPEIGQFISTEPFTSTCGLEGLPGGFYGHNNRTYQEFLWYVYLPQDAQPGPCTIKAVVRMWRSAVVFTPTIEFQVASLATPTPTPTVTPTETATETPTSTPTIGVTPIIGTPVTEYPRQGYLPLVMRG